MNKGDTITIYLNYTVDGVPIAENDFDEIEFSIGSKRYTLTGEDIVWDESAGAYKVALSQADTFALGYDSRYQVRLKKDNTVISSGISVLSLGPTISKETI